MQYDRIRKIIPAEELTKIQNNHIYIFGLGGVGSYVLEALVRMGINEISIIDFDVIDITNLNRQILALQSTIQMKKIDVAEARSKDINPNIIIHKYDKFLNEDTINEFNLEKADYIIDAIDFVNGKIALAAFAYNHNIPIISAMGTGNKMDYSSYRITDITKTKICPLAKKIRLELRKRNIKHLKVICSEENPIVKTTPPGSISYMPAIAGLMIAGEVIKDLKEKI